MRRRDFLKMIGIAPFAPAAIIVAEKPEDTLSSAELDRVVRVMLEGETGKLVYTIDLGYIEDWRNYDFDGEILKRIRELDEKAQV